MWTIQVVKYKLTLNFGLDGLVWIYYFMFIFIGKLRILDFGLSIPFKFIHWIDDSVFTSDFSEFAMKITPQTHIQECELLGVLQLKRNHGKVIPLDCQGKCSTLM